VLAAASTWRGVNSAFDPTLDPVRPPPSAPNTGAATAYAAPSALAAPPASSAAAPDPNGAAATA